MSEQRSSGPGSGEQRSGEQRSSGPRSSEQLLSDHDQRSRLQSRISALIDRLADGSRDDRARDELLVEVLLWQAARVQPYGRLVQARGGGAAAGAKAGEAAGATAGAEGRAAGLSPDLFPAMPTDVFRYARVASHPEERDVRVFRTSGTTTGKRGEHYLSDLSLYDRAAQAAARYALFPDMDIMPLVILAPSAAQAPDSSLSYMLSRFVDWFGAENSVFLWQGNDDGSDMSLDIKALRVALDAASAAAEPMALLGTSLAFAYAEEALGERRWALPKKSRIMLTGGFKGRSRQVPAGALLEALCRRYGVAADRIIQEYGMTELCSQMYETSLRDAALRDASLRDASLRDAVEGGRSGQRRLWAPGWVRCTVVDFESLQPIQGESEGLLRVDDLANLDSVCAVQTSDTARRSGHGVVLTGRAPGAVARGCSIAVDEVLAKSAQMGQGKT